MRFVAMLKNWKQFRDVRVKARIPSGRAQQLCASFSGMETMQSLEVDCRFFSRLFPLPKTKIDLEYGSHLGWVPPTYIDYEKTLHTTIETSPVVTVIW